MNSNTIRSRMCPDCYLCGSDGNPLYENLRDRLFGAAGEWRLKKCSNAECGLVWMDPMPLADDIGKAYQDYYTHFDRQYDVEIWFRRLFQMAKDGYLANKYGYHKERVRWWQRLLGVFIYLDPGRRAEVDFSVMWLPQMPGGRLLEVGCGSGKMLKHMENLGWNVEGVDFDPKAVDISKKRGLRVRLGALEEQNYPNECFDVIIMSHLIEHVYDPVQLLQECYSALKQGGRLIMVTPNNESWGHTLFNKFWFSLDPPRHLHIFNSRSISQLADKAGFKILRQLTTIRDADGMYVASLSIRRSGRFKMGETASRCAHIEAKWIQLVEWLILKFRPDRGEELVLIAKKP